MKRILFFSGLLLAVITTRAQADSTRALKFQSALQVGMMEGEAGTSFQLQSINGIRYRGLSAGIGIGIDYYVMRSIPLFVDLRKDLLNRAQAPFIYADLGANLPWKGSKNYDWIDDTDPGAFYDLGIGYKFTAKANAITISAGYSFKNYSQDVKETYWCFMAPCPEINNHYTYQLRRVSVKAGFVF